jgi:metallo-beta-lactamase class B
MHRLILAAALLATPALAQDDPLTRPLQANSAVRWTQPRAPIHVHGNTWLTGSMHLNTAVIDTGAGLIVVDAALPQSVPVFEQQLREIGHKVTDIRYILSTEPHYDHAGGLAALARDSGATIIAGAYNASVIRAGHSGPEDPQFTNLKPYPATQHIRVLPDGGSVRLGNTVVTSHLTAGHSPGSTSWSWQSCAGKDCRAITFLASIMPGSADGWHIADHSATIAQFRASFATARALPCDILLTGHPEHDDGDRKIAQALTAPDPAIWEAKDGCAALATRAATQMDAWVAQDKARP